MSATRTIVFTPPESYPLPAGIVLNPGDTVTLHHTVTIHADQQLEKAERLAIAEKPLREKLCWDCPFRALKGEERTEFLHEALKTEHWVCHIENAEVGLVESRRCRGHHLLINGEAAPEARAAASDSPSPRSG